MLKQVNKLQKIQKVQKVHDWRMIGGAKFPYKEYSPIFFRQYFSPLICLCLTTSLAHLFSCV